MAKAWRLFLKANGSEPGGYVDFNGDAPIHNLLQAARFDGGFIGTMAFIPFDQVRYIMQVDVEVPQAQIFRPQFTPGPA